MEAYVTLVATEAYASGAFIIAHRLRELGTQRDLVCLVTPNISQHVQTLLSKYFVVQPVHTLRSNSYSNLMLLGRPELDVTFTKIHCWRLVQYRKIVFLDADTLPLFNIDSLFHRPSFSAAPDAGWPDCFNSGVFVAEPSEAVFEDLLELASQKGSFDGGDQGLLNTYFSSWPQTPSHRLPFIFNTTPTAQYGYAPAQAEYGHTIQIAHFIGPNKPWKHQRLSDGNVLPLGNSWEVIQQWWNTWDKYYGKISPYQLLSADLAFDGGFKTLPIVPLSDVIRNAWENEDCDLNDTRRQVNPMPPLSNITVITPEWLRSPLDEETETREEHSREPRRHQDTRLPTVEWDPACEDPPKSTPGAHIPDLSSYQNVWDQSIDDQVWVAPVFQPEPEIMMKPEYAHFKQNNENAEVTFPWESDPLPLPTRIWQDEPSHVEVEHLDKQESVTFYESSDDSLVSDGPDMFALDEPLSPSAQMRMEDLMAHLEEEDEDLSERDLIPINLKSSSRLQQQSRNSSQSTSGRSSARSSRRNSFSLKQPQMDYDMSQTPSTAWNPLDALTKLKTLSENMVLKQSLTEALYQVQDKREFKWEDEPFFRSGGSSPRTPVLRAMASNLSSHAHQQESLRMAQPQMAVASFLEAELDLSNLYQRQANEHMVYFSQDVIREAQRRLSTLVMDDQDDLDDVLPLSRDIFINDPPLPTQIVYRQELSDTKEIRATQDDTGLDRVSKEGSRASSDLDTVVKNQRGRRPTNEEFVMIDTKMPVEGSYVTESSSRYATQLTRAESSTSALERPFEESKFDTKQAEQIKREMVELLSQNQKGKQSMDKLKMIKDKIDRHKSQFMSHDAGRYTVETLEVDSELQEIMDTIERLEQVIEEGVLETAKDTRETMEIEEEETLEIIDTYGSMAHDTLDEANEIHLEYMELDEEEQTKEIGVEAPHELIEIEENVLKISTEEQMTSPEMIYGQYSEAYDETCDEDLEEMLEDSFDTIRAHGTTRGEIECETTEDEDEALQTEEMNRESSLEIIEHDYLFSTDTSSHAIDEESTEDEDGISQTEGLDRERSLDIIEEHDYISKSSSHGGETTEDDDGALHTEEMDRETSLDIIEEHDYVFKTESMSRDVSYDMVETYEDVMEHKSTIEPLHTEALSRETSLDIIEMEDDELKEDASLQIMDIEDAVLNAEDVSYELDVEQEKKELPSISGTFARFLANAIAPVIGRPTIAFPRPSLSASLLSSSRIASASTTTTPVVVGAFGGSSSSEQPEGSVVSRVRSLKTTKKKPTPSKSHTINIPPSDSTHK